MLDLPGRLPIFIIIDALDECPSNTGTPPRTRRSFLDFVEKSCPVQIVSNLFLCITSRTRSKDIQSVLNPLDIRDHLVCPLHEEVGQWEDINSYVRSFVRNNRDMRRWREEEQGTRHHNTSLNELMACETISTIAHGRLLPMIWKQVPMGILANWTHYGRCMPSSIMKALNELPETLDDTYERALLEIPKRNGTTHLSTFSSV